MHSHTSFKDVVASTVHDVQLSQLCLVPAGDTPSSRRLFDALAGGCVPVIMASNIESSLPFRSMLQWREIAVFFHSMECVAMTADIVAKRIYNLLRQPETLK